VRFGHCGLKITGPVHPPLSCVAAAEVLDGSLDRWCRGLSRRTALPFCMCSSPDVRAFVSALLIGAGCWSHRDDSVPEGASLPSGSSCGSFVIPQGGYEPAEFQVQQDCLLDAFAAGRRSSLGYRAPTVEGDPIDVRLTVVDRGVVMVRTDETRIATAPGGLGPNGVASLTSSVDTSRPAGGRPQRTSRAPATSGAGEGPSRVPVVDTCRTRRDARAAGGATGGFV
jgi:hypothetical protein